MSPRGSQRVDRRRRVLVDESRNEEPFARPRIFRGDDEGPLSRYNEAALRALNAPIAHYIPFRVFSLVVWFLAGLVPIMGLMLLDQRRYQMAQWLGHDAVRIFDMGSHGSLTSWCSSTAFALAGLVILAIYSVRRHRRDDYRAHFAVWQWALPIAILASIDSAVGLHGLLQGALDRTLGPLAWGAGSAWWIIAWGSLIATVMIRLSWEMSASPRSVAWMTFAAVCYAWCGAVELEVAGPHGHSGVQSSQAPLLLLGHHFVVFSLVTYARDVVREAMGIVEPPSDAASKVADPASHANHEAAGAAKANADEPSKTQADAAARSDAEGTSTRELKNKSKSNNSLPSDEASAEVARQTVMKVVSQDGEQSVDMSKLSRAERKRLKKEMRRKRAA